MIFTHQEARRRIQDMLDSGSLGSGSLGSGSLRSDRLDPDLSAHMAGCPECRAFAERMSALEAHLAQALPQRTPLPELSLQELARAQQQVLEKAQTRTRRNHMLTVFTTFTRRTAWVAAMALGAFALVWALDNLRPPAAGLPLAGSPISTEVSASEPYPGIQEPYPPIQEPYPSSNLEPYPGGSPLAPLPAVTEDPTVTGLRTYTDPQGLFTLQVPADWPDSFSTTAYLPEKGYYTSVERVCEDLANTPQGPGRQIKLLSIQGAPACRLVPFLYMSTNIHTLVVHVPTNQAAYRYLRIDTPDMYVAGIINSLRFTNTAPAGALPPPGEGVSPFPPTAPVPSELTIEEHPVVSADVDTPDHLEFNQRIPQSIFDWRRAWREAGLPEALPNLNAALAPFGYRLEAQHASQAQQTASQAQPTSQEQTIRYALLQGETVLREDISFFHFPSVAASGKDFVLALGTQDGQGYLLRKDGLQPWDASQSLYAPPVMVGDDLVEARLLADQAGGTLLEVLRGGERIFSFAVPETQFDIPLKGLWSWEGHWVLEVDGFLYLDGANLNASLGYDEIFGWQLLNGKPFYFFSAGGKVGLAYGERVLPLQYDQVVHYRCCEPAAFNAQGNSQMAWFYALKDGQWVYTEIGHYE